MKIIVTLRSNLKTDDDGKYLLDAESGYLLHDEEDVGILLKTHVVPITQLVDGALQTGISSLSEVLWNEKRTPAPDLVAPADLAWLTIEEDEEDFDSEDEQHDEEEEIDDVDGFDDGSSQ